MTRTTNTTLGDRSNGLVVTVLSVWIALATTFAAAVDLEEGFFLPLSDSSTTGLQIESTTVDTIVLEQGAEKPSSSLRGGRVDLKQENIADEGLELPPIPPFHPVHTGQVHYSSVMDSGGTVTYRRDIEAPCDYGMLVFNIGPSKDDLPYHYDVYGDGYLWSDNGGLCIVYPTYTGFQLSSYGPFWRPGYDPTTVRFTNLVADPIHMHRISSRILRPPTGATEHSKVINKTKAGDYIIMGHHNFYGINFYKNLKNYVNGWGPNGPNDSDTNEFGWKVLDLTA